MAYNTTYIHDVCNKLATECTCTIWDTNAWLRKQLKQTIERGRQVYEYALTEQYIVWDTSKELARLRALIK